jgi:hypothetical protein
MKNYDGYTSKGIPIKTMRAKVKRTRMGSARRKREG